MTRFRSVIAATLFLLGCATGGAASQYVATAQATGGMPTWAYFCFTSVDPEKLEKAANDAGRQGWELVTAGTPTNMGGGTTIWCFKRRQ